MAGDEIDHAEEFRSYKRFCKACGQRRKAIDDNHGLAEKGGFDRGRAAGDYGKVGGAECVVGIIRDEAGAPVGWKAFLKRRRIQTWSHGDDNLRRAGDAFADFTESLDENREMMRNLSSPAARQNCDDSP